MELKLGVARRDITPEIGGNLMGYSDDIFSTSIRDRLHATAMVFAHGEIKYAIVNATVCIFQTELSDKIRNRISEITGIDYDNIMLSATHTHSGPNTYGGYGWGGIDEKYCTEIFVPQILEAAKEAVSNLTEVRMGSAFGKSYLGINRRELDANNHVILGQNPWGPFNPRMVVISFRNTEDKPVLNIVHYGTHGTSAGPNTEITRDWPGVMTDALENISGAPTVFLNGPEGDAGPKLSSGATEGGGDVRFVDEIGEIAAKDALSIYNQITSFRSVDMAATAGNIKLPLKARISRQAAEVEIAEHGGDRVNLAGKRVDFLERVVKSYDDGYEDKEFNVIRQSAVRIGDMVFVAFPYEVFTEIGMRIEKMSKFKNVLCLSVTNGVEGGCYFVTEDAIVRGGYEVGCALAGNVQNYKDDADYSLIMETIKNIEVL